LRKKYLPNQKNQNEKTDLEHVIPVVFRTPYLYLNNVKMNSLCSFFILVFSVTSYSHQPEKGKVVATWGPYIQTTRTLQSTDTANSPLLFGLGLLAEADMGEYHSRCFHLCPRDYRVWC
jgi:hypothetical protein